MHCSQLNTALSRLGPLRWFHSSPGPSQPLLSVTWSTRMLSRASCGAVAGGDTAAGQFPRTQMTSPAVDAFQK